jgi:TolB-like protein/DNA-binding winged helix-turn-helix (wHTH) protein/Flp pilus assembly protein TadD
MSTPGNGRVYSFGAYRLDTAAGLLYCETDNRAIALTPRVYDTLLYLLEHPGELLDKPRLMRAIWPNLVVEDNNLDQTISSLRHVLGERQGERRYIVTVRGRGYRFVAPVVESAAGPVVESADAPWPIRPPLRMAAAAGAVAAGILATVLVLQANRSAGPDPAIGAAATVAVLPFRPITVTDRNESLELGMAETLIAGLNAAGLAASPLSAVRRYADVEQDAISAGRALRVQSVLEGHIQRDGEGLRVSARLLDVEGGRQLWADSYDERFTDIFSVQDVIASRVLAALMPEVGDTSPSLPRYTEDAEAYQLYVSGRFHRQLARETGLRQALMYFEQATTRDPAFAPAWVGLADTYAILGVYGILAPHEAFPKARYAVDRAIELAPELSEAYASLGHIKTQYEHDWPGAEQALRHALALNPRYAPAQQFLGLYLASAGEFEQGLVHLHNAQALEPSAPMYGALVGMVLNYQRRYDEAIAQLLQTLELDAELPTAHTYLAVAYLRRGELDAALRQLDRVGSLTPGGMSYAGQIHALAGRRAHALAEIERLTALSREGHAAAFDIATIHAALGDADDTFAWLAHAFEDRSQLIRWLPWDPVFDSLRVDPRYEAMVVRLNDGSIR